MNNFKDDEEKAKNLLKYGYEHVVNLPMKEFDIDELEILREFCTIKGTSRTRYCGDGITFIEAIIDINYLGVNWMGENGHEFLDVYGKNSKVTLCIINNKQTREYIEK